MASGDPTSAETAFAPVDLAALTKELSPTRRGRDAGERGRPTLTAASDSEENQITAVFDERIHEAARRFGELRTEAQKHWSETQEGGEFSPADVRLATTAAAGRFDTIRQTRREALIAARNERARRRDDLDDFKEANRLQREPSYPSLWAGRLMVALAFGILVLETVLNGTFLGRGAEQGLVGGIAVAVVVSGLNVLPAFFIFGPFFRHMVHVSTGWRVLGAVATVSYAAFIVVLNLGVAHYREVSETLVSDIGFRTVERLRADPFGLSDAQSWLLFGLGCFFSVVAFIDGWKRDDAYPEYGKYHRELVGARERYQDEVESVSEELEEANREALDDVRRVVYRIKKGPQERRRIGKHVEDLIAAFDQYADQLGEVGWQLVQAYRAANQESRSDHGIPVCHRVQWKLTIPQIDRTLLGPAAAEFDPGPIEEAYQEATERINTSYEAVRAALFEPGAVHTGDTRPPPERAAEQPLVPPAISGNDGPQARS